MNDGSQCPQCSSRDKVKTITWRMDPKTGKEANDPINIVQGCLLVIGLLLVMALVAACVIAGILPAVFGSHTQGEPLPPLEAFIEVVALLSFVTLPLILPIILYLRSLAIYRRSIIAVEYICANGHTWNVPDGNQVSPSKDEREILANMKRGTELSTGDRVYPTHASSPGAIPIYFSTSPQAVAIIRATQDTPGAIPVYFTDSSHPGAIAVRWGLR